MTRMTLITRVFYSTSAISAWLLEERRGEQPSSGGAELEFISFMSPRSRSKVNGKKKAANSAPFSAFSCLP